MEPASQVATNALLDARRYAECLKGTLVCDRRCCDLNANGPHWLIGSVLVGGSCHWGGL